VQVGGGAGRPAPPGRAGRAAGPAGVARSGVLQPQRPAVALACVPGLSRANQRRCGHSPVCAGRCGPAGGAGSAAAGSLQDCALGRAAALPTRRQRRRSRPCARASTGRPAASTGRTAAGRGHLCRIGREVATQLAAARSAGGVHVWDSCRVCGGCEGRKQRRGVPGSGGGDRCARGGQGLL